MLIKTQILVLHRIPYSDSSWIVKAFSSDAGVISFLIKGGKRKESPFKSALDPLAHSSVVFNATGKSELHFVREANLLHWFPNMRGDLERLAMAQVMAELLLRYAPQGLALQKEFGLTLSAFLRLDKPAYPPELLASWLCAICDAGGYTLTLDRCVRCGNAIDGAAGDFLPSEGGTLCKNCLGLNSPRYTEPFLEDLRKFRKKESLQNAPALEKAFFFYLKTHLGENRDINSFNWLNEVRKICSQQKK